MAINVKALSNGAFKLRQPVILSVLLDRTRCLQTSPADGSSGAMARHRLWRHETPGSDQAG